MLKQDRTVKRYLGGYAWEDCEFEDLQPGQYFKLFEPTGEQVTGGPFLAKSYAGINEDGVWSITCECEVFLPCL